MLRRTRSSPRLNRRIVFFAGLCLAIVLVLGSTSSRLRADSGICGGQTITLPFTDVMGSAFFCSIAEIYFQEITFGTSPTTYSPTNNVSRDQMAAFLSRTLDTGLRRGSRRAALDQFWTTKPHYDLGLGATSLGGGLIMTRSDGLHVWAADAPSGNVYRVRANDGKLLDTWTGATTAYGVVCAMGKVFVTGLTSPAGSLYMIDPAAAPGAVTVVTSALGPFPFSVGFDGNKLWTSNQGSVSIVTPGPTIPWSVTTLGGFGTLAGLVYDGANMWVADSSSDSLKKLDANGNVLQNVVVGNDPEFPIFDGKNIWVGNVLSHSVTVVRASTGEVLATLTGNGLDLGQTRGAGFDGERILVANFTSDSVSLWKASDLTPLGNFSTGVGSGPFGVCSDGQYFWIAMYGSGQLVRF